MALDRTERIAGGLVGLLVGDALGVPYEFHHPSDLPPLDAIEFDPPVGFRRAHARVPSGTWSDDGAQALCLLASLMHCDRLDPDDLARRFADWYERGYLAVGGHVFDIGIQTREALERVRRGVPSFEAGGREERHNGNGSLMRVLPLALWHEGPDSVLVRDACTQSLVTHGHIRSQLCCALYCLWVRRMLEGARDPFGDAVASLRRFHPDTTELDTVILPYALQPHRGTGYVVDCLWSAKDAFEHPTFESVVKHAVAFGTDTDTTAAVAGGLAGVRDGLAAIPPRWRDALRGRELLDPMLDALLERAAR